MKIINYIEDSIPDYALSYLINGDASGLEDGDQEQIDGWFSGCRERLENLYPGAIIDLTIRDDDEGSFCRYPAFGLACNCVDGAIFAMVENEHPAAAMSLPWEEEEEEEE